MLVHSECPSPTPRIACGLKSPLARTHRRYPAEVEIGLSPQAQVEAVGPECLHGVVRDTTLNVEATAFVVNTWSRNRVTWLRVPVNQIGNYGEDGRPQPVRAG